MEKEGNVLTYKNNCGKGTMALARIKAVASNFTNSHYIPHCHALKIGKKEPTSFKNDLVF